MLTFNLCSAFWWIAGDGLGFRRNTAVSPSSGKPYKFSSSLKYGHEHILPYNQQIRYMVANGFCMWDVVQSCQRKGSLDQDIQKEVSNDIRGFCQQNGSIRRIVLANGGTGSSMFLKHFRDWFQSGELVAADHEQSQKAFGRAIAKAGTTGQARAPSRTITLVSAVSVSPAAASYSYETKRDFWEEHVYRPGLEDALTDA
jgi:hypoxanthine-DNA glycosylase